MIRARFLHAAIGTGDIDVLEAEEAVVALLRAAFHHDTGHRDGCSHKTSQFLRRAKEFMQTHMAERIRLIEISRAAGVSPAYLTDVFKRVEGQSLHQYLTQLRLGRALLHLPFTDDLTELALETGFSSHSSIPSGGTRGAEWSRGSRTRPHGLGRRHKTGGRRPKNSLSPNVHHAQNLSCRTFQNLSCRTVCVEPFV